MKILIITVAGLSSRFSKSIGKETLKCIYRDSDENPVSDTLLGRMLMRASGFDKYIIVGGYKFDELNAFVEENFSEMSDHIELIHNPEYIEKGSGWSLYLGLVSALKFSPDEICFVEGDLFLDDESFNRIELSPRSAITVCNEPILADKAVAFYIDREDKVRYIYDTDHSLLSINEPFKSIYNSGQVWKFANIPAIKTVLDSMSKNDHEGTNLVFVERYFRTIDVDSFEIIPFSFWVNCNTVTDYEKGKRLC